MVEFVVCLCIFIVVAVCLINNHLVKKLELAADQLEQAVSRNNQLEWALIDVVQNFSNKDVVVHRLAAQKLESLSRARTVLKGSKYMAEQKWPDVPGAVINDKA